MQQWWDNPGDSRWAIFIRVSLAFVFVLEGFQKLILPGELGAGRFAKIGIPWPDLMGPFVGVVELACGALILVGLYARLAAVPLIAIMVVAIISTKVPILLGRDWLIFNVRDLDRYGFLSMAHETRTDFAMLMESIFIVLAGPGRWSWDTARLRGPTPPLTA
ncbi:putative membrane protein YphA (DoxX/SURF4 family) [Novosphingobium chloroacetimidivorans]|uniref:Putative membrane protein YphA (DoxX/SURF4 family) n=1 Tax=Novosphingobium chloroacetimidivorans TaxID=1428314 RepID=A0A7W7KDE9_9SPHN|nr:DoxX family protein [Novosphingobium chloroacetimidivorans]MBB4860203.1 putative membrane protein YphA (DoxX/SURF4 family) [Novosphingobium chloroacetimidivorans]